MTFGMWFLSVMKESRLRSISWAFPLVGHSHGPIDRSLAVLNIFFVNVIFPFFPNCVRDKLCHWFILLGRHADQVSFPDSWLGLERNPTALSQSSNSIASGL